MKPSWFSSFLPTAKQAIVWLIGMLLTAVAVAVITSYVNRSANLELALKNQQLAQLEKFQDSGATLDTAFGVFNDALSDNAAIGAARAQLRLAISRHAADANADENILGPGMHAYMDHIAEFRGLIDEATQPTNAMPMARAGLELIRERKELINSAEARIGGTSKPESSTR